MVAEPLRGAEIESEGVQRWRVSREDFFRIADLGIFGDNRVEWLDGEIYMAPPPGGEHGTRMDELSEWLFQRVGELFVVRNQNGLICPRAQLVPDFALVRRVDYRRNETPRSAELVIEVSVSTLHYDRDSKSTHYAEAGVKHYWILDLAHRRILVFEEPVPQESRYRVLRTLTASDSLTVPGTDLQLSGELLLG
ncbi:Uma2 family endonuclease [bacterium]|nr:MAG: Uma2 family endonuclease [bacterium]